MSQDLPVLRLSVSESYFAETSDFAHRVRGAFMVDDVDLVVELVGVPKQMLWSELPLL